MHQLGLDFVDFAWDDDIEIAVAAHVFNAAESDEGAIYHPSQPQRVPWSPLTLELSLEHGTTYLFAAHPPHSMTCGPRRCCPLYTLTVCLTFSLAFVVQYKATAEDSSGIQLNEMITSHALPYQPDDIPGERHVDNVQMHGCAAFGGVLQHC